MSKSTIVAGIAVLVLSACGGGSGNGNGSTPTPVPVSLLGNTALYKYHRVDELTKAVVDYQGTRYYDGANAAKPNDYLVTYSAPNYLAERYNYDASGAEIGYGFLDPKVRSCTYTPALSTGLSGTSAVGYSWATTTTETCTTNGTSVTHSQAYKGSVTGTESVTVAAGTFTALKDVSTVTATSPASVVPALPTLVTESTCWRASGSGRTLKCDVTTKQIAAGSTTPVLTSTSSRELVSIKVKDDAASKLTAAYYAGAWAVNFDGSTSGTCAQVTVQPDGTLSGQCTVVGIPTLNLRGQVNADGTATAIATVPQPGSTTRINFTGTLNPATGAGSWENTAANQKGSWTIAHK